MEEKEKRAWSKRLYNLLIILAVLAVIHAQFIMFSIHGLFYDCMCERECTNYIIQNLTGETDFSSKCIYNNSKYVYDFIPINTTLNYTKPEQYLFIDLENDT